MIGSVLGAENIKLSKDMVQSLRASHLERKMVKKKSCYLCKNISVLGSVVGQRKAGVSTSFVFQTYHVSAAERRK